MKNSRIRHINKDGFLSDIEYLAEDNRPLMAVIGDSFVEAIQVNWNASVHGLLYQRLAPDVRVYAFAAAYASLAQYLAWSAYARETYEPDMLVVNVVGNDFLQELPKPGETFSGGFMGMNFFAEDTDGSLVVRRSDRLRETWLKRMARQSAVVAYAYRNTNITSAAERIQDIFKNLADSQGAPVYIANTLAKVDDGRLALSRREVDRFLELLPSMSGLAPQSIVITIDGLRPELYDAARLAKAANSFPATMARYLIKQGTALGYEVIHLEPRFIESYRKSGKRFEFPFNNHWNANGHMVMSEAVQASRTFARMFKP